MIKLFSMFFSSVKTDLISFSNSMLVRSELVVYSSLLLNNKIADKDVVSQEMITI